MAKEFIFPDLGEGITEGELVRWLVKEGDIVKEDQDVAEVETDKALLPIPAPFAGKVASLKFKEGDRIPVGEVLMTFEEAGETLQKPQKEEESLSKKEEAQKTTKESGEKDKEKGKPGEPSEPKEEAKKAEKLPPQAAPHTRKLARELGIKLEEVSGTGPHGRITEEDVRNFAKAPQIAASAAPVPLRTQTTPSTTLPQEDFAQYGVIEKAPLKGIRRTISEHMRNAEAQTVMVTHMDEAIVDKLMQLKKSKAEFAQAKGVKLTLLPFLLKACSTALKDYPSLNASLSGDEIIYKKYYHFGFAIDTEAGLMVPVIKNVDKKSILNLASELSELSKQARERSIAREAFQGHSFTITNIGSIGGKAFTPIIHYPDSAILGVGRSYEKAIVEKGKVRAAWVMPLCLTFDHRVSDGATAARFTNQVIQYLQDPDLLLLEEGED